MPRARGREARRLRARGGAGQLKDALGAGEKAAAEAERLRGAQKGLAPRAELAEAQRAVERVQAAADAARAEAKAAGEQREAAARRERAAAAETASIKSRPARRAWRHPASQRTPSSGR
jgi:hypothetical protein